MLLAKSPKVGFKKREGEKIFHSGTGGRHNSNGHRPKNHRDHNLDFLAFLAAFALGALWVRPPSTKASGTADSPCCCTSNTTVLVMSDATSL